jgi:adenosylhomocysteine nucleosidase
MIALLCATPREASCLKSALEEAREITSPKGMRLFKGMVGQIEVLSSVTGVGKVAAAAGTRYLLDLFPLDAVINYGTAGALSSQVKTAEVIIATELIPGDVGVVHSQGFKTTGPGIYEDGRVVFEPKYAVDPSLMERTRKVAVDVGLPHHLGRVLTCDQVVLDPELRAQLGQSFDALAVEMEGAAAAQVCEGEAVPYIAVRSISDELAHDLVGLEKLLPSRGQSRASLWGKRFLHTVTHPSTVKKARELSGGMDSALSSLSAFLPALLQELAKTIPPA